MLILSLIVSAALLAVVNVLAFRKQHVGAGVVLVSLAFLAVPCSPIILLPAVVLQSLLTCASAVACRGTWSFLKLSLGAALVAYGVAGFMAWQGEREYARLRRLYPFESMEARLPAPRPDPVNAALKADAARSLGSLEVVIGHPPGWYREWQLKRLHENAVSLFIDSPGFGVARLMNPTESGLALRREPVPSQPEARVASEWSPGEMERPPAGDEAPLRTLFEASVLDFANPQGFGYFKDRRHVAGFVSHRFSRVPSAEERWKTPPPPNPWAVRTLELVGLVIHDGPVAYVSDRLPTMDELRDAPTRPLDPFESFALDALRQGDDLFAAVDGKNVRMLGAVRSARQCVACHGGERGDLLGAFSYTLRPTGGDAAGSDE